MPADALSNRDANFVVANVSPVATSGQATYRAIDIQANAASQLPMTSTATYLLLGPVNYQVNSFWELKSGSSRNETRQSQSSIIEIR